MIAHAEAVAALITTAGGHGLLADDLKRTAPPAVYTEVYVMTRPDRNQRVGSLGLDVHRILTRTVGTSQRKAESERAAADLAGKTFTVGGVTYGPLRRETVDDAISDDGDGRWVGVTTWTYA
jgi:hypothetical protein